MSKSKRQSQSSAPKENEAAFHKPFAALDIQGLPEGVDLPLPSIKMESSSPKATPKKGRVILRRETAHRGGKTVIIVTDFEPFIRQDAILEIARALRKACGSGGTVKEREIEIQGEHAPTIRKWLTEQGFRVGGVS